MRELKKIAVYGDSISTTLHGEGGYEGYLKKRFSAQVVNYAVSASGLSLAAPDNTATILADEKNIPGDADLGIMWHGTNDWYWGSPLGRLEDKDSRTFLGAVGEAVRRIRRAAPCAAFVWLTPIYRYEAPDQGNAPGNAYETKNKAGFTLTDYHRGILEASVYHGFPVLDLRRECGIHAFNHSLYLEDGVHPNKAGYERIIQVMERGWEAVCMP